MNLDLVVVVLVGVVAAAYIVWLRHAVRRTRSKLLATRIKLSDQVSSSYRLQGELGYAQRTPVPNKILTPPSDPSRLYSYRRARKLNPP